MSGLFYCLGTRTFFQRSNLQEILSRTGSQNESDQGFPSNGRPKHERGVFEAMQGSQTSNLSQWLKSIGNIPPLCSIAWPFVSRTKIASFSTLSRYYSTDMVLSGFISGGTYNYFAKFVVLHRSLLVKEIELVKLMKSVKFLTVLSGCPEKKVFQFYLFQTQMFFQCFWSNTNLWLVLFHLFLTLDFLNIVGTF